MTIRKLLFIFIIFQSISLTAQDLASLKIEATKSYKAGATMNYEEIFETTYPKVFEIISKDQMKEMMGKMMENEQFSIKMVEVEPNFSFGEIKKIEGKLFCLIDHNNVMNMQFKEPMENGESMVDMFKTSMEAERVTFSKETNSFKIELRSTLIAVADDLTGNKWKFLNKDKENQLFTMIFSEKIMKELGL